MFEFLKSEQWSFVRPKTNGKQPEPWSLDRNWHRSEAERHLKERNYPEALRHLTVAVEESERRGFLVVAPQFAEAEYPHPHAYNYGRMMEKDGTLLPRGRWIFPMLGEVFRDARFRPSGFEVGNGQDGPSPRLTHRPLPP